MDQRKTFKITKRGTSIVFATTAITGGMRRMIHLTIGTREYGQHIILGLWWKANKENKPWIIFDICQLAERLKLRSKTNV